MVFGFVEGYLSYRDPYTLVHQKGFFGPHEFLGSAPPPSEHFFARRYFKSELLYDVIYTIDPHGLRVSSYEDNSNPDTKAVFFFGCSFTFGVGLNDDETVPYLVADKSNGKYVTYNFAFGGYGPHHMLAAFENRLENKVATRKPEYIIYQALLDHVKRSAGKVPYFYSSPRYVLNQYGDVVFTGRFGDGIIRKALWSLKKSHILEHTLFNSSITTDDIDLFVAIIDNAKHIVESRYPGSEFHVLYWDRPLDSKNIDVLRKLHDKTINVHLISRILKDEMCKYTIPRDGHPNAYANKLIAEYVTKNILDHPQKGDRASQSKHD